MPHAGASTEFVQRCEDDQAVMITATDCVDQLRIRDQVLLQRGKITAAVYRESRDMHDVIAGALLLGRRNTAQLRNGVRG